MKRRFNSNRSMDLLPAYSGICCLTATIFAVMSVIASGGVWGQVHTDIIAQTGQAAPDGNGTYSNFVVPVLNDSGQAAFFASLNGTSGGFSDNSGIFIGSSGSTAQIVREGETVPDFNGTYAAFASVLALNDSGQVAFFAGLTGTGGGFSDDSGIFRGSGGSILQIAREFESAPGNGTYSSFLFPVLNESGLAAFVADLTGTIGGGSDNSGIFLGSASITEIARKGETVPDFNGDYLSFEDIVLNDSDQVAFHANLTGTAGGGSDNSGIFIGSGGSITQIAREFHDAPDANGTFSSFGSPALNGFGQVAFRAILTGTAGGGSDNSGIFIGSGDLVTQIAREGQTAPDANGTYTSFSSTVALNDAGQTAFRATLIGTSGGSTDNTGIFRDSVTGVTQIAREGEAAPDANGLYSTFEIPVLNNSGHTAFSASLTGTSGGAADDNGIFVGDGIDLVQAVREGDSLAGSTITFLQIASTGWLNEFGQIVFLADLENGNEVVSRWTPDLHWRQPDSGDWHTGNNWTLGLTPEELYDVFIDPVASLTLPGPVADTTVRSLQIGGGNGLASLNLQNGVVLTATNGVTIQSTGTLTGDGTIAGNIANNGTVLANNLTVASTLTNEKIIRGSGRVHADIVNAFTGKVRALNDDQLWLSGPSFFNSGLVEVHDAELQVDSTVVNQLGTGLISVRNGSLIAVAGLDNSGSTAMTLGNSTIQGDINNTGIIQVSGGAHATFFGDLTQNGTLQVSAVGNTSSTAVLLGAFTGSGGFVGGGDVFALGDLRPGNSPENVLYDGNLFLGSSSNTEIEIGGLLPGDEYDQMNVTGNLAISGTLNVVLINGFMTGPGQQFVIAQVDHNLSGTFDGLSEGAMVPGTSLTITYAGGAGNDIVLFTDPQVLLGDINLDGVVNLLDVDPFIDLLATGTFQAEGDTNQDGVVNLLDVQPFIQILSGG